MKADTLKSYRERILRVLAHIVAHLDDELSLEELARIASFSPYHFHRVFKAMVGETVKAHVRRLRLQRAAVSLIRTPRPITEVAFDAGYETHESFTRAFRARFDTSPSSFRECHYAGVTTMDVRIENREPLRVAYVRIIGPYSDVGPLFQKLFMLAGPKGLLKAGAAIISMGLDEPEVTPAAELRLDACISCGDDTTAEGELKVKTIAGGPYAVYTHTGPYEQLPDVYAALYGGWLPQSGREPRAGAAPFDVYENNPMDTKPADLRTTVFLPLEVLPNSAQ